jgi:hypothetical protein
VVQGTTQPQTNVAVVQEGPEVLEAQATRLLPTLAAPVEDLAPKTLRRRPCLAVAAVMGDDLRELLGRAVSGAEVAAAVDLQQPPRQTELVGAPFTVLLEAATVAPAPPPASSQIPGSVELRQPSQQAPVERQAPTVLHRLRGLPVLRDLQTEVVKEAVVEGPRTRSTPLVLWEAMAALGVVVGVVVGVDARLRRARVRTATVVMAVMVEMARST